MTKKQAPEPPRGALPEGESNRYLAKFKASLCKRWSASRMETLYEISDLAAFLWALERPDEALAVAASVATAVPDPPPLPKGGANYNVWCPATYSHALVARLGPQTLPAQARASRAALLRDAGVARDNPAYLAGRVADARQLAAAPAAPKATKWECQGLARAVGAMVLHSELAAVGDPLFAPHAAEAATLLPPLLARLGARLRSA